MDSLNPWILPHFPVPPGSWSFSLLVIMGARGKAEEMEGDEIQMNPFCHLLAAQLTSIQRGWGVEGGCSSPVDCTAHCYSRPSCCQGRVGCMEMVCGMKEERRGEVAPSVASSNKRERNYVLSGSMPHRVAQILLNKLVFGSILFPQNWRKRDAETVFRAIIMQRMHGWSEQQRENEKVFLKADAKESKGRNKQGLYPNLKG